MLHFFKYIIRSYSTVFFNFKQAVQFFSSVLLNFYECTLVSLSAFPGAGNGAQQAERLSDRACGNRCTAPDMFLPPSQSEKKATAETETEKTKIISEKKPLFI